MKLKPFFYVYSLSLTLCYVIKSRANPLSTSSKSQNVIVIDAGSTGSRIKLYQWDLTEPRGEIPKIRLMKKYKFKPGLASFYDDQPGLEKYLNDIVSAAKTEVPRESRNTTSIFLLGTAGFRYLQAQVSQQLMERVRVKLHQSSFRFQDSNVQVISGEEEAAFLWVAANYLAGFFENKADHSSDVKKESSGVMEIGGGSMQIAFQPTEPLYGEEFHIRVAGHFYQIYAQSYFNFGVNGLFGQLTKQLQTQTTPKQSVITNPCMLRGDSQDITLKSGRNLTMVGTGNPKKCKKKIKKILNPKGSQCQLKPCAIGSVYQPKLPPTKFYAVGPFAPRGVIDMGNNDILNIGELQEAARSHCRKTISQLKELGKNTEWASEDCLLGVYVPILLTQAYGFSSDTQDIVVAKEIDGQAIDWTLGAIILHLKQCSPNENLEYSIERKRR